MPRSDTLGRVSTIAVKTVLPLIALLVTALAVRRFGGSQRPFDGAEPLFVASAVTVLSAAQVLRTVAWSNLFSPCERPAKSALLAGIGASGACAPFLPARLDCAVKLAVINRLQPKTGLAAIGISFVSLGLADFAAMFPVSLMGALTSESRPFALACTVVALANLGACAVIVKGKFIASQLPRLTRGRARKQVQAFCSRLADTRDARAAVIGLSGCWLLRASGAYLLMLTLSLPNPELLVFLYLVIGSASYALPISPGGAAMAVGAGTAILLGSGVNASLASNYALSTAVLSVMAALVSLLIASLWALATGLKPRDALSPALSES